MRKHTLFGKILEFFRKIYLKITHFFSKKWRYGNFGEYEDAITSNPKFILEEMQICREYCSAIHRERQRLGFDSLKYPLISVKINRYFLPDFRKIISDECNLIGYMEIEPVEYWDEKEPYDKSGKIEIEIDITKSDWQQEIYNERNKKRENAEVKKLTDKPKNK